jgi:soluble lytic murein transglycosylase-like protein
MLRIAGPLLGFALAAANTSANAQASATPATPQPSTASELHEPSAQPPTAEDVCRALEQSAAESGLPVEFFARVIWQESRFGAQTVSQEGAEGIAQFIPATASRHGLADPFGRKLAAAPPQFCFRAISDVARSERMTYR